MTNDQLIDDILIRLFKDEDYKIDFPILKIQIESTSNFQITNELKRTIIEKLIVEDLCYRIFWNNDSTLELTPKGKKIINDHGSYSKYLQMQKEREFKEKDLEELRIKNLQLQNDKLEYEKSMRGQEVEKEFDKETLSLMRLAIDSGKKSVPEDGKLTPKVGASIVVDGKTYFAYRGQKDKGNHAEFTLFEKVLNGKSVKGATLFTTLEPCTERNKKPCCDWVIDKGIKHIYIGMLDPNPKIYNNGCKKLRDAGIDVDFFPSELRKEIEKDNSDFINQYHANPSLKGTVLFNYQNNNNRYIIGNNEMQFETKWSKGSDQMIYVYNTPTIKTVAIADGHDKINEIKDGSVYDTSSRYREVNKGEIIILENINGYFAAIKILDIKDRSRPNNSRDELTFEYKILTDKSANFTV